MITPVHFSFYPRPSTIADPHASTGTYAARDLPDFSSRNFAERGFTIGIGGYLVLTRLSYIPETDALHWLDPSAQGRLR
jgi:hypothetical protein